MPNMLYELQNIHVDYPVGSKQLTALHGISLQGFTGETLGIVGESGSGKSTLGRTLLYLQKPTKGHVFFDGQDLATLSKEQLRRLRKEMQIVFQDPDSSLNPKMTVEQHLIEAMRTHNLFENNAQIDALLEQVYLPKELKNRYPFELSGGQKQRVAIARAISVQPKLIVLDEPLSSLDASVRMQIVHLLHELQDRLGISYFFITHDLITLRAIAHRVAVMYMGELQELASANELYTHPKHPYTQALLSSVLHTTIKKSRIILHGEMPSPFAEKKGCPFQSRCPKAENICKTDKPIIKMSGENNLTSCHF